ncbi:M1 family metallopeptidase [Salisaeta longa]|uniref:M1 family metallopeptidase n=1 Tax=Salisaeta longa TaxID=503170 RepID=UPI0012FB5974|nr:M1 family metallopeptidase [Salisaeta longa]
MYRSLLLALILGMWAVPAGAQPAGERPVPDPIIHPPAFEAAIEAGTRTRSGAPGANYWTNTARYNLDVTLHPAEARLTATGTLRYYNNSPDTLRRVALHLRQNIYKEGAVRNRPAQITGGMTVERVAAGGAPLEQITSQQQFRRLGQGYVIDGTRMIVVPSAPLMPGDSLALDVAWRFPIPDGSNFRMGQDGEVFYLGYWYPQFAVYDDVNGWTAEPYMGDGEFYMGYGRYDVSVTVPEDFLVGATGTLENADAVLTPETQARLERARVADSTVTIVAADERGRATVDAANDSLTWHFTAQDVRDFAFGASDRYVWDATHATIPTDEATRTSMIHALYRPDRRLWQEAADYARFSIEHLSDMVYPYPYPHMTAVEGIVGGGMEYPMITIIGGASSPQGLFGVTYHEISHMWFPMIVGTNEKRYAWIDEGTATFNEAEGRADYWEDAQPWDPSEQYYYRFAGAGIEVPSMRHADRYPVDGPARILASYGKPALMLHALRGVLGPEVFFEAYQTFADRWAYKHPTPYDLFNTFEDVAGRELDWFWRSAFYETWTLDQAVASVEPTDTGAVIALADDGLFPMPVLLEITYADGSSETRRVPVTTWLKGARTAEVAVTTGKTVQAVTIDPNGYLPDVDRGNNTWQAGDAE